MTTKATLKKIFTVEYLHLATGILLIISGLLSLKEGLDMLLAWAIFGAMYISMSDIGECKMCCEEKASKKHKIRTMAAYLGFTLSIILVVYLLIG